MTENEFKTPKIRWRLGLGVAIGMMLLALFPQLHFWAHHGSQWHGANAIAHPDEVAYSAYLASLMRGRSRHYDPYTGRGEQSTSAPESLFSIQFVPAFAVALPARWLKLSASTVFMIFPALGALVSSLAIFFLISILTRDEKFSAASVVIILGLGTLVAGQGVARQIPNLNFLIPLWISKRVWPPSIYHLPFLRFYQPAVAFPLFFVFCTFVFSALTNSQRRRAIVRAVAAGITFVLLVFSYFFLWTAAAGWLLCVGALWLVSKSSERKRTAMVIGVVMVFALAALVPYLSLLSRRAATIDAAQALVFTHRPDLFRLPEIVAFLVLVLLAVQGRRGILKLSDSVVLVTASFALSVFVVFNQQVVTGRSLQPIHYEWFVANYCSLAAVVLTLSLWRRSEARSSLTNKRLALLACVAGLWAFGEVWLAASLSFDHNRLIDSAKPALNRLAEFGIGDATGSWPIVPVVLIDDFRLADRLPTDAPQAVLWAPRMLVFPQVSEVENRERFWQQLYYTGYDENKFWKQIDSGDWNFFAGMFPYYRLSPVVSGSTAPISVGELRPQIASYLDYTRSFNRDRAASLTLCFFIVHADNQPDYANLDRWYQRDGGERIGSFILYRLRLRP